jgi:hypothetical protein
VPDAEVFERPLLLKSRCLVIRPGIIVVLQHKYSSNGYPRLAALLGTREET